MSVEEMLKRADSLIQEVAKQMDLSTHTCPSCGTDRFDRWNQKQAADQLYGASTRVQRAIGLLLQKSTTSAQGDRQ